MSTALSRCTKVFRSGGSLAVRLPKNCQIAQAGQEVQIRRDGNAVIIESDHFSDSFISSLGSLSDEQLVFPQRGRKGTAMRVYL